MLMLRQILGISWVALRWYNGSAEGVRRDVWTFEILKNFVVTSPSWENQSFPQVENVIVAVCMGCGVRAHLTPNT